MNDGLPRCLGGHAVRAPEALREHLASQFGSSTTIVSPVCSCGEGALEVTAASGFGPVRVTCPACRARRVIFDPTIHGYDGELGINREMSVDADQPFACPSCAARVFDVAACFQYSGEDEILEDASAPPVAREDLFGWAAFAVRCHGCGHIADVADIECA